MTDIDKLLDAQAERDEEERGATKWKPEPGDTLNGILVKTGWYDGGEYSPSLWLLIKTMDGDTYRVYCPTVLTNRLNEEEPAIGSGIAIRYEGRREAQNSARRYHAYTLALVPDKDGNVKTDPKYWHENGVYRAAAPKTAYGTPAGNDAVEDGWF